VVWRRGPRRGGGGGGGRGAVLARKPTVHALRAADRATATGRTQTQTQPAISQPTDGNLGPFMRTFTR